MPLSIACRPWCFPYREGISHMQNSPPSAMDEGLSLYRFRYSSTAAYRWFSASIS